MDEPSKPSQPTAGERSGNHPRPFFYVQPAVQPFYAYQWQMNPPFSQHGFHGSAFHFARPYMFPYSYLQYPGYAMPHAALQPVDYRRIHERSFPHVPGCDLSLRQYQPQYPDPQRETTCAGAQTDPSEALNKLLECLDQLRSSDSSQTSRSVSPSTKVPKGEEERTATEKKLMSESTMAEDNRDSSCSRSEITTQDEDSSRALERKEEEEEEEEEKKDGAYQDCSGSRVDLSPSGSCHEKKQDEKVQDKVAQTNKEMNGCVAGRPSSRSSPVRSSLTRTDEDRSETQKPQDLSCCILQMPMEKVLSSGVYGSSITPSSLGSPLSYTYRPPQLARERFSVLSPSLDEMSSHDELLSTDFDDVDLFPSRVCTRGKFPEVTSRRCHSSELRLLHPERLTCAMCGSHTFKELSRTRAQRYANMEDSDDIEAERRLRKAAGKSHSTRKTHSQLKHKVRAEHRREKVKGQQESLRPEPLSSETCVCSTEKGARLANTRPERRCRASSNQLQRDSAGVRAQTGRTPQRHRQRKARCKPPVFPSSRNEEDDNDEEEEPGELQYHRTKGWKR